MTKIHSLSEPLPARLLQAFAAEFQAAPDFLVRAPGRVNLIGEHTDYNDGFVLPLAIDRAVWIALRRRADRQVRAVSLDYGDTAEFDLDNLRRSGGWAEYLKGVAWGFQLEGGHVSGWDGVLAGDVPVGAGLSSSAALEMAAARAFSALAGLDWDPARMARAGQRAENEWIGVASGIMDQMVSAAAREGHALFLDCRSLVYQHVALPPGVEVWVLDTGTRRGLVQSAYNQRREQCQAAARHFEVPALRDLTPQALAAGGAGLDPAALRRARHVVSENGRVLEAAAALRVGDLEALGRLLDESHASLRDDFEVSSPALEAIAAAARAQPGCLGARLSGAGFGGCAVALTRSGAGGGFAAAVTHAYREQTGLEAQVFPCRASRGASLVELPAG
jgi:galactokinase